MNMGEQLVGDYLRYIKNCDFIQQNLINPDVQGEIDVVGINLRAKEVYICEVAIHLTTGLRYNKDGKSINTKKLFEKFEKDIAYANKYFPSYTKFFMFWSPIVKIRPNSTHNQFAEVEETKRMVKNTLGENLQLVINEVFYNCIQELRDCVKKKTEALISPISRFIQIEETLKNKLYEERKAS